MVFALAATLSYSFWAQNPRTKANILPSRAASRSGRLPWPFASAFGVFDLRSKMQGLLLASIVLALNSRRRC